MFIFTNHIELILGGISLLLAVVGLLFPDEFKKIGNRLKTLTLTNWLQVLTLTTLLTLLLTSK